jgi:hypothetical protein
VTHAIESSHKQTPTNTNKYQQPNHESNHDVRRQGYEFDGKKKNFVPYWTQMKACVRVHKFAQPETELKQRRWPGPI